MAKDFEDYLLEEYSYIAQAHFKTIETISTFFRHYLVIMSLPIVAVGFFVKSGLLSFFLKDYFLFVAIMFWTIALMGISILCYVIDLRMDAILYARTVNGIRKYFYDEGGLDINRIMQIKTLPYTPTRPAYFEKSYFLPVVFSFLIINSVYFLFGVWTVRFQGEISKIFLNRELFLHWCNLLIVIFISMHLIIYWLYARYRETGYLKSYIIGVDIDGVLNKHREKFCELLKKKINKEISPEQI